MAGFSLALKLLSLEPMVTVPPVRWRMPSISMKLSPLEFCSLGCAESLLQAPKAMSIKNNRMVWYIYFRLLMLI